MNRLATAQNSWGRPAALGTLAQAGRVKSTLFASPGLANLGDWIEQLVAESTGKNGKGIVPIVGEPAAAPNLYGQDRVFVYLQLAGDESHTHTMSTLAVAGHPTLTLRLSDRYDLGGHFFLWGNGHRSGRAYPGHSPV